MAKIEEFYDDIHKRAYFHNSQTGKSGWTREEVETVFVYINLEDGDRGARDMLHGYGDTPSDALQENSSSAPVVPQYRHQKQIERIEQAVADAKRRLAPKEKHYDADASLSQQDYTGKTKINKKDEQAGRTKHKPTLRSKHTPYQQRHIPTLDSSQAPNQKKRHRYGDEHRHMDEHRHGHILENDRRHGHGHRENRTPRAQPNIEQETHDWHEQPAQDKRRRPRKTQKTNMERDRKKDGAKRSHGGVDAKPTTTVTTTGRVRHLSTNSKKDLEVERQLADQMLELARRCCIHIIIRCDALRATCLH